MAKGKSWEIPLGTRGDIAVARMVVSRGRVIEFSVHYLARVGESEVDILRYDTCDGHLHVHRLWLDPPHDRVALEEPRTGERDYTDAFAQARQDVLKNWRSYRAQWELSR